MKSNTFIRQITRAKMAHFDLGELSIPFDPFHSIPFHSIPFKSFHSIPFHPFHCPFHPFHSIPFHPSPPPPPPPPPPFRVRPVHSMSIPFVHPLPRSNGWFDSGLRCNLKAKQEVLLELTDRVVTLDTMDSAAFLVSSAGVGVCRCWFKQCGRFLSDFTPPPPPGCSLCCS